MNFLFKIISKRKNPIKEFIMTNIYSKYVKDAIYLKTGFHVDLNLNEVEIIDENGRTKLHADFDLATNSEEFYKLLDKLAK